MAVTSLFPEDLSEFRSRLGEDKYILVDVRQPEEYTSGHIPGARLMPLPRLAEGMSELGSSPNLVFYCRSGARSLTAATWAEAALPDTVNLVNLEGGFNAYEGHDLHDMPRLEIFTAPQNLTQTLLRAMDLEKATLLFYEQAAEQVSGLSLARTLSTLAKVEMAHAKVLFHRLQRHDPAYASVSFEQCHGGLKGDIIEGGMPLDQALTTIREADDNFCLTVTELALRIELMAYDLYRNLAAGQGAFGSEMQGELLELAQDELRHQQLLARQLPECAAAA